MSVKVDLTRFKTLVREIARYRKKDEAEVLNKGLTTAIIGSSKYEGIVQLTPKATRERIRADLKKNDINNRLSIVLMKREGWYAGKHSREETRQKIAEISKARLAKRLKSRAYIAAGWIKGLQDLGILGSRTKGKRETNFWQGGTAAQGYGVPATAAKLIAKVFNMSRGANKVSAVAIAKGIHNASEDMADYFRKKLGDRLRQLSRTTR